ncbi:hypothetical protein BC827DRAFT_467079 [Russula dissimulans]|nr:hypothetical protein BC827DRAFT_467079 [Russula dissimulans]
MRVEGCQWLPDIYPIRLDTVDSHDLVSSASRKAKPPRAPTGQTVLRQRRLLWVSAVIVTDHATLEYIRWFGLPAQGSQKFIAITCGSCSQASSDVYSPGVCRLLDGMSWSLFLMCPRDCCDDEKKESHETRLAQCRTLCGLPCHFTINDCHRCGIEGVLTTSCIMVSPTYCSHSLSGPQVLRLGVNRQIQERNICLDHSGPCALPPRLPVWIVLKA